jgi:hypothetical protein
MIAFGVAGSPKSRTRLNFVDTKHWRIDDVAWARFDPANVVRGIVPLADVSCQSSVVR